LDQTLKKSGTPFIFHCFDLKLRELKKNLGTPSFFFSSAIEGEPSSPQLQKNIISGDLSIFYS
jgi:hypothetical protein